MALRISDKIKENKEISTLLSSLISNQFNPVANLKHLYPLEGIEWFTIYIVILKIPNGGEGVLKPSEMKEWQEKDRIEWDSARLEPLDSKTEGYMPADIFEVAVKFSKHEPLRSLDGVTYLLFDKHSTGDMPCFVMESWATQIQALRRHSSSSHFPLS